MLMKKKQRRHKLALNYRSRMTEFITKMADAPTVQPDGYNNRWHQKFGQTASAFWGDDEDANRSSIYLTRNRFPHLHDPYQSSPRSNPALRQAAQTPTPFRYKPKDATERVTDTLRLNSDLDTLPHDVDKKSFVNLRPRRVDKELGESHFRTKAFSTVERLNDLYENDNRVMDCELALENPKKRYGPTLAKKKEAQIKRRLSKVRPSEIISPE